MATIIEDVEWISTLKRPEAIQQLAECLHYDTDQEDSEFTQIGLIIDFFYDCLMAPAIRGSSWAEIKLLLRLAVEMQEESKDLTLPEAVNLYKTKTSALSSQLSERTLKLFSEHFFSTFMKHYKLYQYCFTHPRQERTVTYTVQVNAPGKTEALKSSKLMRVWNYEQQYEAIEKAEKEARDGRLLASEIATSVDDKLLAETLNGEDDLSEMAENEKEIQRVIEEVTSAHMNALSHRLNSSIAGQIEDLEYKYEKTILPRPRELGAPPRFKPIRHPSKTDKTATKTDKTPASPKSRGSSGKSHKSGLSSKSQKSGKKKSK